MLAGVAMAKLRGEPFGALGPPRDERDRLSRRQSADLVLLDRAVRRVADDEVALSIARAAVRAGAVPFLDAMLPPMGGDALRELAPSLADSFFNAEGEGRLTDDGGFAFDVSRCRFVELLTHADARHLAPLFCEADELFFDGKRRPIQLHRTRTIANGGASCDFRFTPNE